jgi:hypothetical protein
MDALLDCRIMKQQTYWYIRTPTSCIRHPHNSRHERRGREHVAAAMVTLDSKLEISEGRRLSTIKCRVEPRCKRVENARLGWLLRRMIPEVGGCGRGTKAVLHQRINREVAPGAQQTVSSFVPPQLCTKQLPSQAT